MLTQIIRITPRDEITKWIDEFLGSLGFDPTLVILLIGLLISIYNIKDIKSWKRISSLQKNMDIAIWFSVLLMLIAYTIKFFRGD